MTSDIFTSDFKPVPYWWERTPRPDPGAPELPGVVDVAIVGSGYTGLCAALEVARGGRSIVVLDAEDAGWGCSSRNGGQISTSIKPGFDELARRHGPEAAFAITRVGHEALAWIGDFVAAERIECDFMVPGRFHAAHNRAQFEKMARFAERQPKGLEVPVRVVPRAEQRRELGTDAYHGGVVFETHASLDPARYHQGLLERVLDAGGVVVPRCRVTALGRDGPGFGLATARGAVRARDVIVATNGYTGPLKSAGPLRRDLMALFPELSGVRISHSWMGFVAYTFDGLAHLGAHDGIHYAMGYCGSGVSMASYLGTRIGQQVLGKPEGRTGLDAVRFQARPLYTGKPWFLAASVAYFRWRDRLPI